MGKEPKLITKPRALVDWLDDNDYLLTLEAGEAELLLGYLEGHNYAMGIVDGKMVRVDISEELGEYEDYSIDEFIDSVFEWNFDMILSTKEKMENAESYEAFLGEKAYYEQLKEDEKILDKMFDKTCYGKELSEICAKMTEEMIAKLDKKDNHIQKQGR